jgi:hypothetical protein
MHNYSSFSIFDYPLFFLSFSLLLPALWDVTGASPFLPSKPFLSTRAAAVRSSLLQVLHGCLSQTAATGVHSNRPASSGRPSATSKLYLHQGEETVLTNFSRGNGDDLDCAAVQEVM